MVQVVIPFRDEFRRKILNGIKCMTTRTRKMGNVNDIFKVFGATFKIIAVERVTLGYVALNCWNREGAESMENFKQIWAEIHPIKGYDPEQLVYLHTFKLES